MEEGAFHFARLCGTFPISGFLDPEMAAVSGFPALACSDFPHLAQEKRDAIN